MISGKYVKTFSEANIGMPGDMHCNGQYEEPDFDVVLVTKEKVTLKSRKREIVCQIKRGPNFEYVEVEIYGAFERMMKKPTLFRVFPFKGERT